MIKKITAAINRLFCLGADPRQMSESWRRQQLVKHQSAQDKAMGVMR